MSLLGLLPDRAEGDASPEQLLRAVLLDVADQAAVDTEAAQLLELGPEARGDLARDAELLVLLLADEAGAVVQYFPPKSGFSRRCVPGTSRVAPFSSVKSLSAHMELQMIGLWGFSSGMS